jgi:hypothetical protein
MTIFSDYFGYSTSWCVEENSAERWLLVASIGFDFLCWRLLESIDE